MKRQGWNFNLIKMDHANVILKIKLIYLLQKAGDVCYRVFPVFGRSAGDAAVGQKPLADCCVIADGIRSLVYIDIQ